MFAPEQKRALLIGFGLILAASAILLLIWLGMFLPGFAGEVFRKLAGMMWTPIIIDCSLFLLGIILVLSLNWFIRSRQGDEYVYLEQVDGPPEGLPDRSRSAIFREAPESQGIQPGLAAIEGALELNITVNKLPVIIKGFLAAGLILILNVIAISLAFEYLLGMSHQAAIIYATPLSIISSAVAIPSSAGLRQQEKEFVVYESTFSDILGIMLFNYAIRQFETNQSLVSAESLLALGVQILGVIGVSLFITFCLFQLLQKIEHHVKFFLILALLILVYAFGKYFHLPALVTIFIFGLFLSNVKALLPGFLKRRLDLEETEKGLHEFHILTAESTFLVKTFFFLFFGFSIKISDFTSTEPFIYGLIIFGIMKKINLKKFIIE